MEANGGRLAAISESVMKSGVTLFHLARRTNAADFYIVAQNVGGIFPAFAEYGMPLPA
ncbi:MAG: hypothetical protein ABI925_07325 [Verrucomicrobiota bacterium]